MPKYNDDLISRQAAIVAIRNLYPDMPRINVFNSMYRWQQEKYKEYIECEEAISKLPSVQREKGKWIKRGVSLYRCSECGRFSPSQENYCPSCGSYNGEEKAK